MSGSGSRDAETHTLFCWVVPILVAAPLCPRRLDAHSLFVLFPLKSLLCGTLHRDLWNLVSFQNMYFNLWNFQHLARHGGHNLEVTSASGQHGCHWSSPVQGVLRSPSCAACWIPLALLSAAHPQESWNVSWFCLCDSERSGRLNKTLFALGGGFLLLMVNF